MEHLLQGAYPGFLAALSQTPPVSIRLNPWKMPAIPNSIALGATPVPWHEHGYYLPERPVFALDPYWHGGAYYVQEASSMLLGEALRQHLPPRPLNILDLCAAPGGKSTLLADLLGDQGILVSNETIRGRVGVLRENLGRWGRPNKAIVSAEAEEIAQMGAFFDVVVTDAPCSGEGLFRKDPDAAREWSPAHVDFCAARQRRILAAALDALKPGGILAYSTCTFNQIENENNAQWLSETFGLRLLPLSTPPEWGMEHTAWGTHCYPHRVHGEGFFIALFQKQDMAHPKLTPPATFRSLKPLPKNLSSILASWLNPAQQVHCFQTPTGDVLALPSGLESDYLLLDKVLKQKWFGTNIGVFKGTDFVPSHELALSALCHPSIPTLELSLEESLQFLKKETFEAPEEAAKGWVIVRYGSIGLGWVKILPNRLNNYLPAEWRLRMRIEH